MRRMATLVAAALLAIGTVAATATATTPTDDVTPSTNEENKVNGWAHFNVLGVSPGEEGGFEVVIEYVEPRDLHSCFERRIDGEGLQPGVSHPTDGVEDGVWSFTCVTRAATWTETYLVNETLEIRLVCCDNPEQFFTWTPVSLTDDSEANPGDPGEPAGDPGEEVTSPHIDGYCKNGAWAGNWFRNQGLCIASVQANENADKAGAPGDPAGESGEEVTSSDISSDISDIDGYCKNGAWAGNGFRNQGQCLATVQANENAGE